MSAVQDDARARLLKNGCLPYGTLKKSDFQADDPPKGAPSGLLAHTNAPLTFGLVPRFAPDYGGLPIIYATVVECLIVAGFDPQLSWWGYALPPVVEELLLRHEQGHLDITEINARQLNADPKAQASFKTAVGKGASNAEALDQLIWVLAQIVGGYTVGRVQQQNDHYDLDTYDLGANRLDPVKQAAWDVGNEKKLAALPKYW